MYKLLVRICALLLLSFLIPSCNPPVPPQLWQAYRTHSPGGHALPWTLTIRSPNNAALLATRSHSAPSGVLGGFEWRYRQGKPVNLTFSVAPQGLAVPNRAIVRLEVNSTAVFWGVAMETPDPASQHRSQVQVVGGRELLGRTVIGTPTYENMDVGAIARALISAYKHPALTYDAGLVPDTGKVLSKFTAPYLKLDKALDALAKSVPGVEFDVDAQGRVWFGPPPVAPTVGYPATVNPKDLPVSGDEIITRMVMIGLTQPSGATPTYQSCVEDVGLSFGSIRPLIYQPIPLAGIAEHPSHATYGAEEARIAPAGLQVLGYGGLPITDDQNVVNPALALDTDPSTAATNGPGDMTLTVRLGSEAALLNPANHAGFFADNPHAVLVGFRLVYGYTPITGAAAEVRMKLVSRPATNIKRTTYHSWVLPPATDQAREITAMLPPPDYLFSGGQVTRYQGEINLYFTSQAGLPANAVRIYTVQPIWFNAGGVVAAAAAGLRPPATELGELVFEQLITPARALNLTGVPGYSAPVRVDVAEQRYVHTSQGLTRTTVSLGQADTSEATRMLRLVSSQQAQGAVMDAVNFLGR